MKEIKDYERAKLELIHLDSADVIATSNATTSGPLGDSPNEPVNWDNAGGWT